MSNAARIGSKLFTRTDCATGSESSATLSNDILRNNTRSPDRSHRTTCSATLLPAFREEPRLAGVWAIRVISNISRPSSESGISNSRSSSTRWTVKSPWSDTASSVTTRP